MSSSVVLSDYCGLHDEIDGSGMGGDKQVIVAIIKSRPPLLSTFAAAPVLNPAGISFVLHHGRMPPSCRKRHTDLTAPLSVSFFG
jgi:hypothetical protein